MGISPNSSKNYGILSICNNYEQEKFTHVESQALYSSIKASGITKDVQKDIAPGPALNLGPNNGYLNGTQVCKHICTIINFVKRNCITVHHLRFDI